MQTKNAFLASYLFLRYRRRSLTSSGSMIDSQCKALTSGSYSPTVRGYGLVGILARSGGHGEKGKRGGGAEHFFFLSSCLCQAVFVLLLVLPAVCLFLATSRLNSFQFRSLKIGDCRFWSTKNSSIDGNISYWNCEMLSQERSCLRRQSVGRSCLWR